MSDYLATADDLSSFPGAPYDDFLVEVAQASVRAEAGWHIAPVRTETLYLTGTGSPYLSLPSLRVVSISAVRYGPYLTEYTSGWTFTGGGLYLSSRWTVGPVEVDIVHGYDETPIDLLPVIANRAQAMADSRDQAVQSMTQVSGPFTNTYRYGGSGTESMPLDSRVARYALPGVA